MAEPIAQNTFRATLVTALAKLLSLGATKAATYDCRVGTSISTKASRAKNNKIANFADGANGTAISSKLEGKCVNTMVLTSPIRRASHAAPRCERAFNRWTTKNTIPRSCSDSPNRLKNQ